MNKRAVGAEYEQKACDYLVSRGYVIVERNFHCRIGEIDIIAKDGSTLVFVEVKYRKDLKMGSPLEAIDKRKQYAIRRTALHYLYERGIPMETAMRFDAIGILGENIEHIKDAF